MNIFEQSVKKRRNSNQFDLSYENKLTTKFGQLLPFYMEETLPGDKINVKSDIATELAPLLSNLKHMVDVHVDFFYVTNDSIWSNWRDFISGGEDYDQNPTLPYLTYNEANKTTFQTGTLADAFGLPTWDKHGTPPIITNSKNYQCLPFRAYQHIYNEWYRDQDLVAKVDIEKDTDGASGYQLGILRYAAWDKDIFTTCRPEAQKTTPVNFLANQTLGTIIKDTNELPLANQTVFGTGADGELRVGAQRAHISGTVQELRRAEGMQKFLEAMQRGGNRYNEYLNTMWGVDDQDQRLELPQLIYSNEHPLKINEVITTTNADNTTTDNNTAGQAYGRATAYANNQGFQFTAPDYGHVIGIVKYSPRPAYFQGVHERWERTDRLQWYTDHLAEVGEDVVYRNEIYMNPASPTQYDGDEFGYHHRYISFKQRYDQVTGDFKYGLKFQHLGRELNAAAVLNQSFIEIGNTYDSGLTRIFNVIDPDLDYIWVQVYNDALYNRDVKYITSPV